MSAPLLSRPDSAEKIRREIEALRSEINEACDKRDRLNDSIKARVNKLNRLQAQLAMATPGPALSLAAACG